MRSRLVSTLALSLTLSGAALAQTHTINFDSLAIGTTVSNQFTATTGATFSAGGLPTALGPNGAWATNTDLTAVSATGADIGGFGAANGFTPPSGNLLRSFNGWLNENGDPVFTISFATPITSFSATFTGISTSASTRIFAYNASNTQIGLIAASLTGTQRLSLAGLTNATKVIITPGDFNDWVGVDDITFTLAAGSSAPEPGTLALLGLGILPGVLVARRRRAS